MPQHSTDLQPGRKALFGVVGIIQAALAFLAFWDLAHRPADQVRGPKWVWTPVILINWIGPLTYFYAHRERR